MHSTVKECLGAAGHGIACHGTSSSQKFSDQPEEQRKNSGGLGWKGWHGIGESSGGSAIWRLAPIRRRWLEG